MGALDGRVALVTGGGSGMGREIALAYAEEGAAVAIASAVPDEDEAVADECRRLGGQAIAAGADVRDEHAVEQTVARCLDAFGGLDVVVAAAGVDVTDVSRPEERYLHRLSLEQWSRVIDVNLTGVFLTFRAALPPMLEAGSGSLLSFSSGTVRRPVAGLSAYTGTKHALEGLTQVLAAELEGTGVRVNAIQPGGVTNTGLLPPWADAAYRARMHQPSVIRALAVHLASDDARDVSGESLVASDWNRAHGLVLCPCELCTAPPEDAHGTPATSRA